MSTQDAQVKRVVEKLVLIRKNREISQRELATKAGLSHSGISEMEAGKNSPTLHYLLLIALVLEIDLGTLVTEACREE